MYWFSVDLFPEKYSCIEILQIYHCSILKLRLKIFLFPLTNISKKYVFFYFIFFKTKDSLCNYDPWFTCTYSNKPKMHTIYQISSSIVVIHFLIWSNFWSGMINFLYLTMIWYDQLFVLNHYVKTFLTFAELPALELYREFNKTLPRFVNFHHSAP